MLFYLHLIKIKTLKSYNTLQYIITYHSNIFNPFKLFRLNHNESFLIFSQWNTQLLLFWNRKYFNDFRFSRISSSKFNTKDSNNFWRIFIGSDRLRLSWVASMYTIELTTWFIRHKRTNSYWFSLFKPSGTVRMHNNRLLLYYNKQKLYTPALLQTPYAMSFFGLIYLIRFNPCKIVGI